MTISQIQYDALELARKEKFVANGSSGDLTLLKYLNGGLETYLVISNGWDYSDNDYKGNRLDPEVLYEVQIHESQLIASQVLLVAAFKHEGVIYQIIRPSPLPPTAMNRFWRFWITPQENAA